MEPVTRGADVAGAVRSEELTGLVHEVQALIEGASGSFTQGFFWNQPSVSDYVGVEAVGEYGEVLVGTGQAPGEREVGVAVEAVESALTRRLEHSWLSLSYTRIRGSVLLAC